MQHVNGPIHKHGHTLDLVILQGLTIIHPKMLPYLTNMVSFWHVLELQVMTELSLGALSLMIPWWTLWSSCHLSLTDLVTLQCNNNHRLDREWKCQEVGQGIAAYFQPLSAKNQKWPKISGASLVLSDLQDIKDSFIVLDLSTVFEAVNHEILLDRLQNRVGSSGPVLDWFRSYLSSSEYYAALST